MKFHTYFNLRLERKKSWFPMLRNVLGNLLCHILMVLLLSTCVVNMAKAQEKNTNSTIDFTHGNQMTLPENFNKVLERSVKHNGIDVELIRYEKDSTAVNYGTKNISFLIRKNSQLEGLSRLLPEFDDVKIQLSQEESEQIAIDFLKKYAPDLLMKYDIQWIGKHSEEIREGGKKVKVAGMKVKCRNIEDGLYFWVIVAPDKSIMVFERDVEWDFIKAGRQTEQWLHDTWLRKN